MVTEDGSGEIDWDAELERLQRAAAEAYERELETKHADHQGGVDHSADRLMSEFDWVPRIFDTLRGIPLPGPSLDLSRSMRRITGDNNMSGADVLTPGETGAGSSGASSGILSAFELQAEVEMDVDDWQGTAASSFRGFFDIMPAVIDNQVTVAKFLGSVAEANAILLQCARRDAIGIIDDTVTALEGLEDDLDFKTLLSVVAALFTIRSGIPDLAVGGIKALAGGVSILTGLSSGTSAISDKAAATRNEATERQISGFTVEEVLRNMVEAVGDVQNSLIDGEALLTTVLGWNTTYLHLHRAQCVAPRPHTFVKQKDFDKFRPPRA